MRSAVVRPFVSVLFALALAAVLAVPPPARAQFDDGDDGDEVSGSVDLQGLPGMGGFNMNVKVKEGGRRQGTAQGKVTRREEYSSATPGQAFKVVYAETDNGSTGFKVLEPEGYAIAWDSGGFATRDTIPCSFSANRGEFYRVVVSARNGAVVFDKKLEAKAGMLGTLWISPSAGTVNVQVQVNAPPPMAPAPVAAPAASCMGADDLGEIKEAIENEGFSDGKIGVLESAAAERWFCAAQVIEVLELMAFSADKLKALRILAPHIVDTKNNFKIINALTFSGDKEEAKKILR